LPDDAFVMAAFGNVYKINQTILNAWFEILKRIPHSVLWLMNDNPTTTAMLTHQAKLNGIHSDKIIFTDRASHAEYRAKLTVADIFLDSFPYNCGSTSRDVLNAGIPMVTLSGQCMVSRMGGSILNSLGLTDLVCQDIEAYVEKIAELATDSQQYQKIKSDLQNQLANLQHATQRLSSSVEQGILNILNK